MPCPFHNGGDSPRSPDAEDVDSKTAGRRLWSGVGRRDFLKTALAIGGTASLSACLERTGPIDVAHGAGSEALPERQFAWNDHLPTGRHGNVKIPNHQLLLLFNYAGNGRPTSADREQVSSALESIERAYQYGTGGEFNATSTQGLLTLLMYSRAYFDRFDRSLPASIDLPRPDTVIDDLGETARADTYDTAMVLTSDNVQVLLEAEQGLLGRFEEVNGVQMDASFEGVFDLTGRRTGFIGVGRPADELDTDEIEESSPTAMGYRSGFKDNQATESRVAISDGPFAEGSTVQLSRLVFDLDAWYDMSEKTRVERMFSPDHTPEDVGEIGERLAGQSRITEASVEDRHQHADRQDSIGHTQKVAAARDDSFEPTLLRRSEGVSTDLAEPSLNFLSLQRRIERFLEVRRAMNAETVESTVPEEKDGIRGFINVRSRATFLLPPRSRRALPALDK